MSCITLKTANRNNIESQFIIQSKSFDCIFFPITRTTDECRYSYRRINKFNNILSLSKVILGIQLLRILHC